MKTINIGKKIILLIFTVVLAILVSTFISKASSINKGSVRVVSGDTAVVEIFSEDLNNINTWNAEMQEKYQSIVVRFVAVEEKYNELITP